MYVRKACKQGDPPTREAPTQQDGDCQEEWTGSKAPVKQVVVMDQPRHRCGLQRRKNCGSRIVGRATSRHQQRRARPCRNTNKDAV